MASGILPVSSTTVQKVTTLAFDPSKIVKGFAKVETIDEKPKKVISLWQTPAGKQTLTKSVRNKPSLDCVIKKEIVVESRELTQETEWIEGTSDNTVSNQQFECAVCREWFPSVGALSLHMSTAHVDEHKYSVAVLPPAFTPTLHDSPEDNPDDSDSGPAYKKYTCDQCDRKFYSLSTFKNHYRSHTGKPAPHGCPMCHRAYYSEAHFKSHLIRVHNWNEGDMPAKIKVYSKEKPSAEDKLVIHVQGEHRKFKCALCSKTFTRLYRAREHARTHSGLKPFKCSRCSKQFASSEYLYRHIKKTHKGGFSSKKDKETAPSVDDGNGGDVDDDEVRTASDILMNVGVQNGSPIFSLSFSSRTQQNRQKNASPSRSSVSVQSHSSSKVPELDLDGSVLEGSGKGDYQCSLCNKTFLSSAMMNLHLSEHKMSVQAKCLVCHKSFLSKHYLKRHMAIHTGEKSYVCSYCNKAYARKYHLKHHLRTHTGEKPYVCPICGKMFVHGDYMHRHVKKMHKGIGKEQARELVQKLKEREWEKSKGITVSQVQLP